jgi:hypothetical protein
MKTGEGSSIKKSKKKNSPIKKPKKKEVDKEPETFNFCEEKEEPLKSDRFSPTKAEEEKKLEKSINFKKDLIALKLNQRLKKLN